MILSLDIAVIVVVNLLTVGAMFGMVKVDINWIKHSLQKLETKVESKL